MCYEDSVVSPFYLNLLVKIKYSSRESMGNPKHNQFQELYQLFLEQFPREIHEAVKYTIFSNIFQKIVPHLQSIEKKHPDKKNLLFDTFSPEKWSDLG